MACLQTQKTEHILNLLTVRMKSQSSMYTPRYKNAVYENSLKSHLSTLKIRTDCDVVIKTVKISSADLEVLKSCILRWLR